jgi:hypothetical protein
MTHTMKLFCFLCAVSLLLLRFAMAGPAAYDSVASLAARADAIVVGAVQAAFLNGSISATIRADRVIKGSITQGTSIAVVWTFPPTRAVLASPGPSQMQNGHGIVFLQQSASGVWSILPATIGDAGWEDTYIQSPSAVPAAIGQAALASLPANPSTLDNVLVEMVAATEAGSPTPFDLIQIYRQSRSPVLAAAFARFLSSVNPNLQVIGLRGLILSGSPAAILRVQQSASRLASTGEWSELIQDIRTTYLNTSSQSIKNLGQVASDTQSGPDLRIAAAVALARVHTPQTLPYLAPLLDDPNTVLEAAAVGGLSSFANNVPIGSHEPAAGPWIYRTDDTISHSAFDAGVIAQKQSYYLGFWKTWWQQHQAQISQ